MGNPQMLAFYITLSCISFAVSKIIISILLYRRWKRKHKVYEDDFSGIFENYINYMKIIFGNFTSWKEKDMLIGLLCRWKDGYV